MLLPFSLRCVKTARLQSDIIPFSDCSFDNFSNYSHSVLVGMETVGSVHVIEVAVKSASVEVGDKDAFACVGNGLFYGAIEYCRAFFKKRVSIWQIHAADNRIGIIFFYY